MTLPLTVNVPRHSPQLYDWLQQRLVDGSSRIYSAAGSIQLTLNSLVLGAGVGSASAAAPAVLAGSKGKVSGATLTKASNVIAGQIGEYAITGTKATTFPTAGLMGVIGNGVTAVDAAVMAVIAAGSTATTPQSAFGVACNNSNASSKFQYGLDLYGPSHDSLQAVAFSKALIRSPNQVCVLEGSGAPTNGGSGTGLNYAAKGSTYYDYTNGRSYLQTGASSSPQWVCQSPLVARVSTQFDKTSSATAADVTGLSLALTAGRTYKIKALLHLTVGATGGLRVQLGAAASLSATAIVAQVDVNNNAGSVDDIVGRLTALGAGAVTAAGGTSYAVTIEGLITVNAGGNLTVQFAQSVSDGTASSVLVGSTLEAIEVL